MIDPRNTYREASARGVCPLQSVVCLYEQIIEDLRQVLQAMEHNQIELRTNKINHAILVIGYLQSRLNFEKGGKVAETLDQFYNILRADLVDAQFKVSAEKIAARLDDLLGLREAWAAVVQSEAASLQIPTDVTSSGIFEHSGGHTDWKG